MGPEGQVGPEGRAADIISLEAKVDSLNAVIEFILGGKPEDSDPLTLGETELRIRTPMSNSFTEVTFEVENMGDADAVDVRRVVLRFRNNEGAATAEIEITATEDELVISSSVTTADYTLTYSQGGPQRVSPGRRGRASAIE